MTRLQLLLNGIFPNRLLFAVDDKEKCRMIRRLHLVYMVDDKPDVIHKIRNDTQVICISARYNEMCEPVGMKRIKDFAEILDIVTGCQEL